MSACAPIAVIGAEVRVPGARSLREFRVTGWSGSDAVSRRDAAAATADAENWVAAAGVLSDADCVDAEFFSISAREVVLLDPQQRLLLEVVWSACEDAGRVPSSLGDEVGVFASSSATDHLERLRGDTPAGGPEEFEARIHGDREFVATRLAYTLNLRGPAVTLNTACSSGLMLITAACQALQTGLCDAAIVAAACARTPAVEGYTWTPGSILSRTGRCRPFTSAADGTVPGDGVAATVLKRLDDALAAGDHIRAVISGFALNNDGSEKLGFTAPSAQGQARGIVAALRRAGVDPSTLGLIETHGTGTALGDPLELEGLAQAFAAMDAAPTDCVLGASKAHFGHLDTVAGLVSFVRAVLAVEHNARPPYPDAAEYAFDSRLERLGVRAASAPVSWPSGVSRRALVSALGIGGTNAFVVVENAPIQPPLAYQRPREPYFFPIAAATAEAGAAIATSVAAELRAGVDPAQAAFQLQDKRSTFGWRRVVVADSAEAAIGQLEGPDGSAEFKDVATDARIAFMFPGYGSAFVDMGRRLVERDPEARRLLSHHVELAAELGVSLRHLLRGEPASKASWAVDWAGIIAVELTAAQLLVARGVRPDYVIGHSLGEIAAACTADVFDARTALEFAIERGRLCAKAAVGGAMASLRCNLETLDTIDIRGCEIASINSPSALVLAGDEPDIDHVIAQAQDREIAARRLALGAAFHSWHVGEAALGLAEWVATQAFRPPTLPLASNVTGDWMDEAEATTPDRWADHMQSTVRFHAGLETIRSADDRPTVFLEVGPGAVLSTFALTSGADAVVATLEPTSVGPVISRTVARVWELGADRTLDCGRRYARRGPGIGLHPFRRVRPGIAGSRETAVPSARPQPQAKRLPPERVEVEVREAWGRYFHVEDPGLHDDFHALGGTSLGATVLTRELSRRIGVPLSPDVVLTASTLRALTDAVVKASRGAESPSRCLLELAEGAKPPWLFLHGILGEVFAYRWLARRIAAWTGVGVIAAKHPKLAGDTGIDSLVQLASWYGDAFRERVGSDPQVIVGHSFGGMLAVELARIVRERSDADPCVVLVDTPPPDAMGRRPAPTRSDLDSFLGASDSASAAQLDAWLEVMSMNWRAGREHTWSSLDCRGLYVTASDNHDDLYAGAAEQWAALVPGLAVTTAPGDHHSVLDPPHVDVLYQAIVAASAQSKPATETPATEGDICVPS